jgi:hypothetical protein
MNVTPEPRPSSIGGEALKLSDNAHDQGAQLFQEVQEYTAEKLEAESAKVRRLIDWHIMPIVSFS